MPDFIKFTVLDPEYKVVANEEAVSVAHIVKIVPRYYQQDQEGKKFLSTPVELTSETIKKGFYRDFTVHDIFGNTYSSAQATDKGQRLIDEIWKAAL